MRFFGIIFFVLNFYNSVMAAPPTTSPPLNLGTGDVIAQGAQIQKDSIKVKEKQEMVCTGEGDAMANCECTKKRALTECITPSGQNFKRAAQFILTLPSMATPFMTGGDTGQMAEMCKLAGLSSQVANMLNGAQGTSCERAISACTQSCVTDARTEFTRIKKEALKAAGESLAQVEIAKSNYEDSVQAAERHDADCSQKATAQMQMAQQQMQANLSPMAGLDACTAALDEDGSGSGSEVVDCSLSRFSFYPECSTVGKANSGAGNGVTYDPSATIATDDSEPDLPELEDREAYWDALKNKTSGSNGSGGGGMGALGSGGGSGGFGALGKNGAGGAARKTGSSLLSGGADSGGAGGGGWGNGNDGFDKKFAKLGAKKNGLNMLTKKKIGGRQLASDLAPSTEDIWTRVYLRTNTNCTKQLLECTANKSLNPYGLNKSR